MLFCTFEQELFVIEVNPVLPGTQSRMQWLNQSEAVKRNEAYAEYEKI